MDGDYSLKLRCTAAMKLEMLLQNQSISIWMMWTQLQPELSSFTWGSYQLD